MTLALGIGINTGIFTLLYSVAFRPLPVEEPEIGLDVDFKPDLTVFGYMFAISMLTGVVFGLAPAIQSRNPT